MDETRFTVLVTQELAYLADTLESTDTEGLLDIEYLDGVLTLQLEDGSTYVINKHTPTRQIWVSSPLSGASYYPYDEETGTWRSVKGVELRELVRAEMREKAGLEVEFKG